MRRNWMLGFLGAWCLALPALADTPGNPAGRFEQIPKRNVFGLKAPEVKTEKAPEAPPPNLVLEGITTILGNKRALLKELPAGGAGPTAAQGKLAEPAKEKSLMLTEGQKEGDVEVLQIDEHGGTVKVNNSGRVVTLTFDKNGPKAPSTPPSGAPSMGAAATNLAGTAAGQQPGSVPAPVAYGRYGLRYPLPGQTNTQVLPSRETRIPLPGTAAIDPNTAPSPTGLVGVPPALLPPDPRSAISTPDSRALDPKRAALEVERAAILEAQRQVMQFPQANLPNRGSGTFTTPAQEGIAPALAPPAPQ